MVLIIVLIVLIIFIKWKIWASDFLSGRVDFEVTRPDWRVA